MIGFVVDLAPSRVTIPDRDQPVKGDPVQTLSKSLCQPCGAIGDQNRLFNEEAGQNQGIVKCFTIEKFPY
mgnify:CR=1 FL=1